MCVYICIQPAGVYRGEGKGQCDREVEKTRQSRHPRPSASAQLRGTMEGKKKRGGGGAVQGGAIVKRKERRIMG